jgi:Bacterial regulatory proteins, luxR family
LSPRILIQHTPHALTISNAQSRSSSVVAPRLGCVRQGPRRCRQRTPVGKAFAVHVTARARRISKEAPTKIAQSALVLSIASVVAMDVRIVSAQTAEGPVHGPFQFDPLPASAACVLGGAGVFPLEQPFTLPSGYTQTVIAREGDGGSANNWDMNTLNETGPFAGRFLYRAHETLENGQITVTDLATGITEVLASRPEIGRILGRATRTVEKHVEHLLTKLHVENRTTAAIEVRTGLMADT